MIWGYPYFRKPPLVSDILNEFSTCLLPGGSFVFVDEFHNLGTQASDKIYKPRSLKHAIFVDFRAAFFCVAAPLCLRISGPWSNNSGANVAQRESLCCGAEVRDLPVIWAVWVIFGATPRGVLPTKHGDFLNGATPN